MKKQYTTPAIQLLNIYMENATMAAQINIYSATGGETGDPDASDDVPVVETTTEQLSNRGNIWGNKGNIWGE